MTQEKAERAKELLGRLEWIEKFLNRYENFVGVIKITKCDQFGNNEFDKELFGSESLPIVSLLNAVREEKYRLEKELESL